VLTLLHRQRGVTLIELMTATVIALTALAAVVTVYSATAHHSALQLQSAHLHQQVYGIVHLVGRDLRRAGFRAFDPQQEAPSANPFQQGENRLRTAALAGESADSCILLAYDLDRDGKVGVGKCHGHCAAPADADNVEQFGFRLHRQSVQARYGGTSLACDSGYWQAVNDPDVEITALSFTLHEHCVNLADATRPCTDDGAQLLQAVVDMSIGARLRNHPGTAVDLVQRIAVRNGLLREAAP
jgi:prepilin peptidase dependent protein B